MNQRRTRGFAQDTEIVARIEGMEVEFDETATLFPVELQEVRDLMPGNRPGRRKSSGRKLH